MLKTLILVAVLAAATFMVLRLIGKTGGMEGLLERMLEDSPPKWMFANISAIRQNTDRILERFAAESVGAPGEVPTTAMRTIDRLDRSVDGAEAARIAAAQVWVLPLLACGHSL